MNRTESVLLNYLQTETNHAILLTGEWGSGKTHYIKNVFFEKAREIKTIGSGAQRGYEPVLISLFGTKSIDDVKDRIWISLYPIINHKYTTNSLSVLKCIVKSVDITKLLGIDGVFNDAVDNIEKTTQNITKKVKEKLDFDKLLICFDDLERTNEKFLSNDELLGFINSLVEHDNNKVILIANEDKMDNETFVKIKEKTIGYTLHFEQSFQEVFDNFISSYATADVYKQFLKKHFDTIYGVFGREGQGSINYRTLKNFVSVFGQVFNTIEIVGIGIKPLEKNRDSILIDILKFTLGVCIEFRRGEISYNKRQDLEDYYVLLYAKILGNDSQKESYLTSFIHKYIVNQDHYTFYASIYDAVTGGNIFDIDILRQELRKKHHIVDDNISIFYEVYNKIMGHEYLKISDSEYRGLLRQLKDFAFQEQYMITEYPTILYALLRDNNPLYLSVDKLTDRFQRIIYKKKNNHKYHPLIDKHFSHDPDSPLYKYQKRLIDAIFNVNEEAKKRELDVDITELRQLFVNNFPEFYQRFLIFHYQKTGYFSFEGFSPHLMYVTFLRLNNDFKVDYLNILRVGFFNAESSLEQRTVDLFSELKVKVDNKIARKILRSNSSVLFLQLKDILGRILATNNPK